MWGTGWQAAAAARNGYLFATVTIPLQSAIDGAHTVYVTASSATHCPGSGQAAAGYACIYQKQSFNMNTPALVNIANPETGITGVGRFGFEISVRSAGVGVHVDRRRVDRDRRLIPGDVRAGRSVPTRPVPQTTLGDPCAEGKGRVRFRSQAARSLH